MGASEPNPNRTEPIRTEPDRTGPNRSEPDRTGWDAGSEQGAVPRQRAPHAPTGNAGPMPALLDLLQNHAVCFALCERDAALRRLMRLLCKEAWRGVERWAASVGGRADARGSAFVAAVAQAERARQRPAARPQQPRSRWAIVRTLPEVRGAYALCPEHRDAARTSGRADEVRLRHEDSGAVTVRAGAGRAGCALCQLLIAGTAAALASICSRFHVVRLHEGVHFSYALTLCGRLLLTGRSTASLLDRAPTMAEPGAAFFQTPPELALRDASVGDLSADGACAVLAVTAAGAAVAWGCDRGGWLGLGPRGGQPDACGRNVLRPVCLPFFAQRRVRSVALGWRSDPIGLAVCCDGELYAWGGTGSVCTVFGAAARVVPWGQGRWRHHAPRLVTQATDLGIRCRTVEVVAPPCYIIVHDDRGRRFGGGLRLEDAQARPLAPLLEE